MEDGAQSKEASDAGGRSQRRILAAQVRHPSEDMAPVAAGVACSPCRAPEAVLRIDTGSPSAAADRTCDVTLLRRGACL
jgi:hypothetical protein